MTHLLDWLDVEEDDWKACILEALAFGEEREGVGAGAAMTDQRLAWYFSTIRCELACRWSWLHRSWVYDPFTVTPGSGDMGDSHGMRAVQ